MHRWRKPPIFALAYISPARSSKRRMSIIFSRIARHLSASGSGCSVPRSSGGVRSTARWGSPFPSPSASATLRFFSTSIASEVTPSFAVRPGSGRPRARRKVIAPTSSRTSTRNGAVTTRLTHFRRTRSWSRAGRTLLGIEQVRPRSHASRRDEGWQLGDARCARSLLGRGERVADRPALDALEDGPRVELARGRGEQHVVHNAQVPARGKRLPHRGEREGDHAARLLRERGGERRIARV